MFVFLLKLSVICFIFLGIPTCPFLAENSEHFFEIRKSDMPLPKITVEFSRRTTPISRWLQEIEKETSHKEPVSISINLDGFSWQPLLSIADFLSALSKKGDVNCFTPLLILRNTTSYKFNKIFSGVQKFFIETPNAVIHYYHVGVASPRAAQTKLGYLSSQFQSKLEDDSALQKVPSPIKQSAQNIKKSPPKFVELGSLGVRIDCADESAKDILEMLQNVTLYDEVEDKTIGLMEKWQKLSKEEWPPLGLTDLEQVKQVHIEDDFKEIGSPLVLEVSGLLRDSDVQKVVSFCKNVSSIRCIRIVDSDCSFSSFLKFCELKDEDDMSSVRLREDKIRFLDLQTALSEGIDAPLEYFKSVENQFYKFSNYFVWIPQRDPHLNHLNFEQRRCHELFEIFLDYLALLSEFK